MPEWKFELLLAKEFSPWLTWMCGHLWCQHFWLLLCKFFFCVYSFEKLTNEFALLALQYVSGIRRWRRGDSLLKHLSLHLGERERVQKKTFTKWVNSHLVRVETRVNELYQDLRDGRKLITLLEIISGEKIVSVAWHQLQLKLASLSLCIVVCIVSLSIVDYYYCTI